MGFGDTKGVSIEEMPTIEIGPGMPIRRKPLSDLPVDKV